MIRSLFFALAVFIYGSVSAQNGAYSISGTVADSSSSNGVELATIVLKTQPEGKMVVGTVSEASGKFLLEKINAGKYELTITSIGYMPLTIPLSIDASVNLGNVKLSSESKTLGEAVVTSERALIVKNSEKTVYNVSQSPTNQTGTAEDVLRNMPGVSVDQKGNISIIGKQGVKVLVDGRPNAMAQNDLPSFLRSVPANSIEAIELITNPSARYDAEGSTGIINIKLKKGKADGLNGSVSAGYGFFNRYNGSLAINYRKNKINVFANYSVDATKNDHRWIEDRIIGVNDSLSYYNLNSKGSMSHLSNSTKFGLDYFIDDKNTLTYTGNVNFMKFHWFSDALGSSFNVGHEPMASYNSTDNEYSHSYAIINDISYRKKFDTTDRELDIDVIHSYVKPNNDGRMNSLGYDTSGTYDQNMSLSRHTQSDNKIHNVVFQLDYIHPLKKLPGYKIEIGAKNETTLSKNVFNAYGVINGAEIYDSLLSNHFNYTENIAAGYFIMSGAYKKVLSYSAGLRGEHTFIQSNNTAVKRNYFSLFPSATITASFNEAHTLSASYSRRIQRPEFRQINNTISYIDQYSTWQGNSFLRPAFSHIVSINYTAMVKKHMFSLEASGNFLKDGFIEFSHVDTNRITRGGNVNGSDCKSFNFTFYTKLQLTKWWDLQLNNVYSYSYYAFKQGVNTAPIAGHSYNLWGSMSFKFWKNASFEINGWLNTGGAQPQGTSKLAGVINASIKKSFLKDKLTVAIAGNNLAESMTFRWTVNNDKLFVNGLWQSKNRTVMVTLSYRFGSNSAALERKEKEGNSRLSGGGGGR